MEEYKLFDNYLSSSKSIRSFCEDREKMMFEVLRMDITIDGKSQWLEFIGAEIDSVMQLIEKLSNERKSHLNFKE
jgi:hypothetical protein